jgi:hypothetical protein
MTHLKDNRGYSSLIELINGDDSIKGINLEVPHNMNI